MYAQQLKAALPPLRIYAKWQQVGKGGKVAVKVQEKSPLDPIKGFLP